MTIIIPAAGYGTRLGIWDSKELFRVSFKSRLIDYSLDHVVHGLLQGFPPGNVRVVVVIRPHKFRVLDYVRWRLPSIAVYGVRFDCRYHEWPGSIYSARRYFSEFNLVLLPDSFITLSHHHRLQSETGRYLLDLTETALAEYNVVMGVKSCRDRTRLCCLGAVFVDQNGIVRACQDKPAEDFDKYNGFWGFFGFRGSVGAAIHEFMSRSVRHEAQEGHWRVLGPVGSIPVAAYSDLGQWHSIAKFRNAPPFKFE